MLKISQQIAVTCLKRGSFFSLTRMCGPAAAPCYVCPPSFSPHAAKEVRGVSSPILPTQETTAWLDQNEAASWPSLGIGWAWGRVLKHRWPEPLCFLHAMHPLQTRTHDLEVVFWNPNGGEDVDYGALPLGFSSKFTRSLWDCNKSLYFEPQYHLLSNGQWAVWCRAGALDGESLQPLQALTLAVLPYSVSPLPQ